MTKPTILIADDEPDFLELLKLAVEGAGMSVVTAEDGLAALEIYGKTNVHAVVSDLRMPRLDGIGLLKEIRSMSADHVPFIFVTGFTDLSVENALELGAEALLEKPVEMSHLLETLNRAMIFNEGRNKRRKLVLSVSVTPHGTEASSSTLAVTDKGMFVATNETLPAPMESVDFKFVFNEPEIPPIEGKGVVRWIRQQQVGDQLRGIGINFTSIPKGPRARVLQMLRHHGTKFED